MFQHLQTIKTRVKTVSFTRFFLLMVLDITKATKSKTQVSMAHAATTRKTQIITFEQKNRLNVFWISLGLLDGHNKYGGLENESLSVFVSRLWTKFMVTNQSKNMHIFT